MIRFALEVAAFMFLASLGVLILIGAFNFLKIIIQASCKVPR